MHNFRKLGAWSRASDSRQIMSEEIRSIQVASVDAARAVAVISTKYSSSGWKEQIDMSYANVVFVPVQVQVYLAESSHLLAVQGDDEWIHGDLV